MLTPTMMQVPGPQAASKAGMNNSQNNDAGDAAPTDTSFSQTLSKEIAGRDQSRAEEVNNESKVNAPVVASAKKSSGSKEDDDSKASTDTSASEDINADAVNLSTETATADMLALVGSLNQATTAQLVSDVKSSDAPGQSVAPGLLIASGQKALTGQDLAPGLAIAPGQIDVPGLKHALDKIETKTKVDRTVPSDDVAQDPAIDPLIAAALAKAQPADNAAPVTDAPLPTDLDPAGQGHKGVGQSGRQDGLHASTTGLEARSVNASKNQPSDSAGLGAQHVKPDVAPSVNQPITIPVQTGQSSDAFKELKASRSADSEQQTSGIERAEPQNFKQPAITAALGDGRGEGFRNLTDLFKNKNLQQDGALTGNNSVNFQVAPSASLMQAVPLSASSPFATGRLAPEVGSSNWGNAVGQQVIWMASNQQQTASLTLNPPDLGPLHVEVSISNDKATANFFAAQPEVRQALEAALPRLREMMSDAGIQLGQTTVGTSSQQQQAFNQNGSQSNNTNGTASGRGQDRTESISIPVTAAIPNRGGRGMVDTFA